MSQEVEAATPYQWGDDDEEKEISQPPSRLKGEPYVGSGFAALQQQLLIQQVISDLTDRSYEKCVTSKPSETLSGSQVACIKSTVNKWLDTNEFMTGRLAKKQQMAQQQGQF